MLSLSHQVWSWSKVIWRSQRREWFIEIERLTMLQCPGIGRFGGSTRVRLRHHLGLVIDFPFLELNVALLD